MKRCLTKHSLSTVLLLFVFICTHAVDRKITGTVKSVKSGDVIYGATIGIKGVDKFTLTDFDGRFEFMVPEYTTELIVTYPGMRDLQYSIPALGALDVVIEMTPGKTKGKMVKAGYGNSGESNQKSIKEARGAFILNYSLKTFMASGLSLGMLNKVGFTVDCNYLVDAESITLGGSVLVRNGVYGKKRKAGFYTQVEAGYEVDGFGAYYAGLGEIFDFGWFQLSLSFGYRESYIAWNSYNVEAYASQFETVSGTLGNSSGSYYDSHGNEWFDGIYFGVGYGFNFGK